MIVFAYSIFGETQYCFIILLDYLDSSLKLLLLLIHRSLLFILIVFTFTLFLIKNFRSNGELIDSVSILVVEDNCAEEFWLYSVINISSSLHQSELYFFLKFSLIESNLKNLFANLLISYLFYFLLFLSFIESMIYFNLWALALASLYWNG